MRLEYENIAKNKIHKNNRLNSCIHKEQTGFTLGCFFHPFLLVFCVMRQGHATVHPMVLAQPQAQEVLCK